MLEDNLIKQLYYFRTEKFKGYNNKFSSEKLIKLLDEIEENDVKDKITNYILKQDDNFAEQYCKDTEYFYGRGLKDGISIMLDLRKFI